MNETGADWYIRLMDLREGVEDGNTGVDDG